MTIKEIIDGLKFTIDMFLFNPITGETYTEPRNDLDKTTVDTCKGAIAALEQTRWIPVSERLPEKNGRYIVTRGLNACGTLWNRVYIANYSDLMGLKKEKIWWSGNVGKSDFERHDDVIAWMPLPEPYKVEREKENDKKM